MRIVLAFLALLGWFGPMAWSSRDGSVSTMGEDGTPVPKTGLVATMGEDGTPIPKR